MFPSPVKPASPASPCSIARCAILLYYFVSNFKSTATETRSQCPMESEEEQKEIEGMEAY